MSALPHSSSRGGCKRGTARGVRLPFRFCSFWPAALMHLWGLPGCSTTSWRERLSLRLLSPRLVFRLIHARAAMTSSSFSMLLLLVLHVLLLQLLLSLFLLLMLHVLLLQLLLSLLLTADSMRESLCCELLKYSLFASLSCFSKKWLNHFSL